MSAEQIRIDDISELKDSNAIRPTKNGVLIDLELTTGLQNPEYLGITLGGSELW